MTNTLEEIELYEFLSLVHQGIDTKSFVTVAKKNNDWQQWHYKFKDIVIFDGEKNVYVSMNTYYRTFRRLETIRQLRTLFIDLDVYVSEYSKDAVLYFLQEDYFCVGSPIPMPSLTVDSGRGLYLIWLIEAVPSQLLPLWNAVQNYLYNQLKDFGADPKALDATRVLRVVGTVNTKSNTKVKVLINKSDLRYSLKELQEDYLPPLVKTAGQKGRKTNYIKQYEEPDGILKTSYCLTQST